MKHRILITVVILPLCVFSVEIVVSFAGFAPKKLKRSVNLRVKMRYKKYKTKRNKNTENNNENKKKRIGKY
jgi:hypothetical protein